MHPDRVVGSVFARDDVGKGFIDFAIAVPSRRIDGYTVDQIVKRRPQHAIRKAVVPAVDLIAGQDAPAECGVRADVRRTPPAARSSLLRDRPASQTRGSQSAHGRATVRLPGRRCSGPCVRRRPSSARSPAADLKRSAVGRISETSGYRQSRGISSKASSDQARHRSSRPHPAGWSHPMEGGR